MPAPLLRVRHALAAALIAAVASGAAFGETQTPAAQTPAPAPPQTPNGLPPRPDPRSVPRPAATRIKVTSFKIEGADKLGAGRVKAVLGTKASSWIPWGRKRYFDRAVFDADLRRTGVVAAA